MSQAPPHDVGMERIVLGSMMLTPDAIDDTAQIVGGATAFYHPPHMSIYKAIIDSYEAGVPVDPSSVGVQLASTRELSRVGGASYLVELIESVPVSAQVGYYARKVRDLAVARQLAVLAKRAHDAAHTVALTDPGDAIERIRRDLDALDTATTSDDFVEWADLIQPGLDAIEGEGEGGVALAPVSTGIADLDEALNGGLHPGQVIVVAGRTSMGKSVLARTFVRSAAFEQRLTTGMFSIEMTKQEIFNTIVAAECELPLRDVESNQLDDRAWARIARRLGEIGDAPFYLDDSESITVQEIRAKARRLKKKHGLGLLVVDYLQLVDTAGGESRQVAVAEMSRYFKKLAKELMCPVVVLAQLNRGPEQRADKRPNKADLRESGAIENDANVIILIHREEYYDKNSSRRGEADLIIDKNRSGPQRDVVVAAQLHISRFVDMGIR